MRIATPGLLIVLATTFVGPIGCAPRIFPAPAVLRRIAVLPPCDATGAPLSPARAGASVYSAPSQGLGTLLAAAARDEITRRGFDVVDPVVVERATGGRVPSSPETAAEIVRSAKLDAVALFMRVRRWRFFPQTPAMRTDETVVSLDAMLVDPATGRVVWQVRRPTKPVPLYETLIGGQADAVAAQEVMKEVFRTLGQWRAAELARGLASGTPA